MTEFELIARHFARASTSPAVALGNGDDCALIAVTPGHVLATSTDMLVAGRHFFDDVDPASLGWKTLAVNLSDLAAIGARPLAFTLALALPEVDDPWLTAFSRGLFECADAFACELVGGDTTRGPLTLCVTVYGEVTADDALRRDAARPGDDVWVSGRLGGARHALALERARRDGVQVPIDRPLLDTLERPVPRVALGRALAGVAHAAIDLSDGLAQDLGHVLAASAVGATIDLERLPLHAALVDVVGVVGARHMALAGGDDYELCFTAPRARRAAVERAARASATPVACIGSIVSGAGLQVREADAAAVFAAPGYDHFA